MALILQVVAAVLTVLGAGTLYWGTTPSLLSLGNTVMVVGAVIAASGIVLFGLAAVLAQLGVLAGKLDDLRWAMGHVPAEPAVAPASVAAEPAAEQVPEPSPFWREGLPELPVRSDTAAGEARGEPGRAEAGKIETRRPDAAETEPPRVEPPSRPTVTPPSRESFGLRPLGTAAAVGAAAGLAAGAVSASAAGAMPAVAGDGKSAPPVLPPVAGQAERDAPELEPVKVETIEPVLVEPAVVEPVVVEPVVAAPASIAAGDDRKSDETTADAPAPASATPFADDLEEHLAKALEDLKQEVRAAEADITPPAPEKDDEPAGEPKAAAAEPHDPMASLEKLLLGEAPARAPAPAPAAADEREPGGFMARLRDTFARPPAPAAGDKVEPVAEPEAQAGTDRPDPPPAPEVESVPEVEPVREAEPAAASEPAPAEPAFSIEDELEKALKASLEDKPIGGAPDIGSVRPEPPVYASPETAAQRTASAQDTAPEPRVMPEPAPRPAPEPVVERADTGSGRDDAMASLVRDFPELNDLLAPKKKPVDPADSLIEDLKGIFEPQPGAPVPARQEPAISPPAPVAPPPAAPPPQTAPLLREGVIAGIPFRLYGDGTIEADLDGGTMRFTSLKEFRAHVGG